MEIQQFKEKTNKDVILNDITNDVDFFFQMKPFTVIMVMRPSNCFKLNYASEVVIEYICFLTTIQTYQTIKDIKRYQNDTIQLNQSRKKPKYN